MGSCWGSVRSAVGSVMGKFYIGSNNNKKYAGTIRIEVIDTFGCSHDFFYNAVIDQEDCQFEPE